jgi:hypothetical protein
MRYLADFLSAVTEAAARGLLPQMGAEGWAEAGDVKAPGPEDTQIRSWKEVGGSRSIATSGIWSA